MPHAVPSAPANFDPAALPAVVAVCGHYGVGKTNLSLNLALDAAEAGRAVTLADLDVVNPYFRSSDSHALLAERGVRLVAPVFAGTNLDGPSISNRVATACGEARAADGGLLIIDAGGDDAGATALGRFAREVAAGPYELLYVVNRCRNLTQEPAEAVEVLREVERACRLAATAVVGNTHLMGDTDASVVEAGAPFARAVADEAGLPLRCVTVPRAPLDGAEGIADRETARIRQMAGGCALYPVRTYVKTPWE